MYKLPQFEQTKTLTVMKEHKLNLL